MFSKLWRMVPQACAQGWEARHLLTTHISLWSLACGSRRCCPDLYRTNCSALQKGRSTPHPELAQKATEQTLCKHLSRTAQLLVSSYLELKRLSSTRGPDPRGLTGSRRFSTVLLKKKETRALTPVILPSEDHQFWY